MRLPAKRLKPFAAAAALAMLGPLAGCGAEQGGGDEVATGVNDTNRTLATAIGGAPGLTTISGALSEAGLGSVFDGPGSYTLLAPDDDAFGKLDDKGKMLSEAEHRAELVAILRGHILPGHLTPDAIKKAIAAKKGPVTMTTLADSTVTFAAAGDTISVSGEDGTKATIDGEALIASNGVVLPIDGLVKATEPAPAS